MDITQLLLDLGERAIAILRDHPVILLVAISFVLGWRLRKSVDNGQIRGLKAQVDALKAHVDVRNERLLLASVDQGRVTRGIATLNQQFHEFRQQIERGGATAVLVDKASQLSGTIGNLEQANSTLGSTLTISGAGLRLVVSGNETQVAR
jgi:hypothetical protein